VRVAELKPGAAQFTVSDRLTAKAGDIQAASLAPTDGGHVAVWWERGSNWVNSTLHARAYDNALQAEAASRNFGSGWPVSDFVLSERNSGLRIATHPTNARSLVVASLQESIQIGLASRQVSALELKALPKAPNQWGTAAREGASVVALKNGCWLVSWNSFASVDSPLFSRRVCDSAGSVEIHPLHRWGLGEQRAPSEGVLSVTMDGEQVVYAIDAFDATLGADRVRLSFVPNSGEP
jgi:hypothetical protein